MEPQEIIGRALTSEGAELVLYCRAGIYTIRVDGQELMTSRAHGSERELARLGCAELGRCSVPRVLVGGLGMGFTVRAALDCLPPKAAVVVAEVIPEVVEWCRGPLAGLAGIPLEDPRVTVRVADVWALLGGDEAPYDVVLLDVDNGPVALSLSSNRRLYGSGGLLRIRERLRPGGVLALWSASPDRGFEKRLRQAGLTVRTEEVPVRRGRPELRHVVYVARMGR